MAGIKIHFDPSETNSESLWPAGSKVRMETLLMGLIKARRYNALTPIEVRSFIQAFLVSPP